MNTKIDIERRICFPQDHSLPDMLRSLVIASGSGLVLFEKEWTKEFELVRKARAGNRERPLNFGNNKLLTLSHWTHLYYGIATELL